MPEIIADGEGGAQALHEAAEIGVGGVKKEVEMIGHKGESVQDDIVDQAAIEENLDKESVIIIGEKDLLLVITTVHGMVIQAGFVDA